MKPIQIRYRLTLPEFMSACNAHWSAHRLGTLSNIITGVIGVIVGIFLLVSFSWPAIVAIAAGVLLLFMTGIRWVLWRRAFRDARKYNDEILVRFENDIVHVESSEGKSDLRWNFFTWYLNTPTHVLLYTTKRNFSVIPKASFQDAQMVEEFVNIVRSKLQKIR